MEILLVDPAQKPALFRCPAIGEVNPMPTREKLSLWISSNKRAIAWADLLMPASAIFVLTGEPHSVHGVIIPLTTALHHVTFKFHLAIVKTICRKAIGSPADFRRWVMMSTNKKPVQNNWRVFLKPIAAIGKRKDDIFLKS
ncbi:MAG TPA: hypothetical protein VEG25_07040 [Burkholderiales bacterium]|nr:hypothetical protein [Burkholderiales bacterium]